MKEMKTLLQECIEDDPEKMKDFRQTHLGDLVENNIPNLRNMTAKELLGENYELRPPIISGLLCQGTYILAGSPKVGKSFLAAQIAINVSNGTPLWGHDVRKCGVAYFALEDSFARLQQRLCIMGKDEVFDNENLSLICDSKTLGDGFIEQIRLYLDLYPSTELVIIDTLQKIRGFDGDSYSYSKDYEIIKAIKNIADLMEITIILVHHTRKMKSDDCFDMISGTNGLLGCADGAFILAKEERTSDMAIFTVSGRDIADSRLILKRNSKTLAWDFEREEEAHKPAHDEIIDKIVAFMQNRKLVQYTPTTLCEEAKLECSPLVVKKKLNIYKNILLHEHSIKFSSKKSNGDRLIVLERVLDN